MRKTVEQRVIEAVAIQFGREEGQIKPEQDIFEDLGGDSLDAIELVIALENEFDIEVSDEDFAEAHTVQELIDLVNGRLD